MRPATEGSDAAAVEHWLRQWTPDQRRQVEQLADLVLSAASAPIDQAVKWKRLTFTADRDWHHWLCGIAVTRADVRLVFHKGSLLDDPAGLMQGSGRYVRELQHEDAIRDPEAATALIEEAIAHQRDMLPTDSEDIAMSRRRFVQVASLVWSTTGAAVAVMSLPNVSDDAIVLVGSASVVLPLCAAAAALALRHRHDRLAGLLLLISAATPTYFAYPANVPALVVGLAMLGWPAVTLGDRRHTAPTAP